MKNITIGLFTYQRPNYLKRQLKFFEDLGFNFRLLILDGSQDKDIQITNERIACSFKTEYYNIIDVKDRHVFFFE